LGVAIVVFVLRSADDPHPDGIVADLRIVDFDGGATPAPTAARFKIKDVTMVRTDDRIASYHSVTHRPILMRANLVDREDLGVALADQEGLALVFDRRRHHPL
jgi:hypothetical protein